MFGVSYSVSDKNTASLHVGVFSPFSATVCKLGPYVVCLLLAVALLALMVLCVPDLEACLCKCSYSLKNRNV